MNGRPRLGAKLPGRGSLPVDLPTALPPALLAAALWAIFAWVVLDFGSLASILEPVAPGKRLFVERDPLPVLALRHLALSFGPSLASLAIAFPAGLASFGRRGVGELADRAASFGEAFPTVALMALLVPSLGYGPAPVAVALALYGVLPILRATVAGLGAVPAEVVEAARGMGMSEGQAMFRVRLPIALPSIIQGARVCLVVNVAAATVGAAVGAGGLGVPIVSGIRSFDPLLILKGSIPAALLALAVDASLRAAERLLPLAQARAAKAR